MTTTTKPKAPAGLAAGGRRLWHDVLDTFELRADELRVLESAARTVDLIDDMRAAMKGQPLMVPGSMIRMIVSAQSEAVFGFGPRVASASASTADAGAAAGAAEGIATASAAGALCCFCVLSLAARSAFTL